MKSFSRTCHPLSSTRTWYDLMLLVTSRRLDCNCFLVNINLGRHITNKTIKPESSLVFLIIQECVICTNLISFTNVKLQNNRPLPISENKWCMADDTVKLYNFERIYCENKAGLRKVHF